MEKNSSKEGAGIKKTAQKRLLLVALGLSLGLGLAEAGLWVYDAVAARRVPVRTYEDGPVEAGTIRMGVLGGSVANGCPYSLSMRVQPRKRFNLLSGTAFLLEHSYGCAGVEIDNYAGPNWSAETTVNHYFERTGKRPDMLVVYSGQNETTRYYTPNMNPPPAALSPLARLKLGDLLLRRLFTRQVAPEDQRYTGKFFSENIIPGYERQHNLSRYRMNIERLIRHARDEKIFIIVVIPQSNYLFPPTRSVYHGPADREAEALALFKRAWEARYVKGELEDAEAILKELLGFCSFADLYYELGQLYYSRGEFATALPYLKQAREADAFPICITPAYREILRELVEKYEVPHIDMDDIIRNKLGRPVPDYQSFLDDCHLRPEVYLALSREIIRVMRENGFSKLELRSEDAKPISDEWMKALGITPAVWMRALLWEANYHASQVDYTFRKLIGLRRALSHLRAIRQEGLPVDPKECDANIAQAERMIQVEEERMRRWIKHDGPMPIGAFPDGAPPEGFGGGADIEVSQGNALMTVGQYELAVSHYRAALEIDPDHYKAHVNLASALYSKEKFDEAVDHYERAIKIDPEGFMAHWGLGRALMALERFDAAVAQLRKAALMSPGNREVLRDYCVAATRLAWRLATDPDAAGRDGERAVILAEEVVRITDSKAYAVLDALAAAYAEVGRFEDAAAAAGKALELAQKSDKSVADVITRRLESYRASKPWREEAERHSDE